MTNIDASAVIREGVIIGDNVTIEADVFIDHQCIIRDYVHIKKGSRIGPQCILGETSTMRAEEAKPLEIGENTLLRSGTIIYADNAFGPDLQTGHRVTIREKTQIGSHVRVGTLSDIQGYCTLGNHVHLHSNVHIGQQSVVDEYAWIFPYVILTNDPTPPSELLVGVHVEPFAVITTGCVVMPGLTIGKDALVGGGAVVTKDVPSESIVVGNPAKVIGNVRKIKNHITGEPVYPWRYTFSRGMPWAEEGIQAWEQRMQG